MPDLPKIQKVALWCPGCGAVWHTDAAVKEGDECPVCKVIHENELDKARKMVESEKSAHRVAFEKRWQEMIERENRLHETGPALNEQDQKLANKKINEEVDSRLGAGEGMPLSPEMVEDSIIKTEREKQLAELRERVVKLDEREAYLIDREKRLTADIENFRKSHPEMTKKEELLVAELNRIQKQIDAYKWFESEESKGANLAECVVKAQIILDHGPLPP